MQSLTIVHTESHRQWGGQEIRIFNECTWMHRRGHRVVVIAPRGSCLFRRSVEQGWETHAVGFRDLALPFDMLKMRRLLKALRPHVLNTHGNIDSKAGLAAAWGLGIPCVIRSRHHSPPVRPSWYNRLLYRRLCDVVFTTGDVITRQLVADLDAGRRRVITITSGIAVPPRLPDPEDAQRRLAAELGLAQDTRFIGCVSLLDPGKGQDVLIDAFARLSDAFAGYHLVFIGDGAYGDHLRAHVPPAVAARVHFAGFREDPWPCFRALDCHVLASTRHEGTPQVILQAMFAGCPVVATRTGAIPGVVRHEVTGLLAEPGDAASLAGAVRRTLSEPVAASRRAREALRYVRARHTLDAMGRKILSVYGEVLEKKGGVLK